MGIANDIIKVSPNVEIHISAVITITWSNGICVVEEVHHKVPLSEGGTHEDTNLVALCSSCHARWHAVHGDRWNKDRQYSY